MRKWSILILTQPSRERFLARLLSVLRPQIEEHPDIEVKTRLFDSKLDLGTNRQAMIDEATCEYLNFIDDDDLVPANYVSTIYPLLDGVDYIGFHLQYFVDGVKQKPTYHSLKYPEWNADQQGYYRDISHVNPIRRDLALTVKMGGGFGEDQRWADALRAKGIVKTEHFINGEAMYYYLWRSTKDDSAPPSSPQHATWSPSQIANSNGSCPKCASTAVGRGGGMKICNQCGFQF